MHGRTCARGQGHGYRRRPSGVRHSMYSVYEAMEWKEHREVQLADLLASGPSSYTTVGQVFYLIPVSRRLTSLNRACLHIEPPQYIGSRGATYHSLADPAPGQPPIRNTSCFPLRCRLSPGRPIGTAVGNWEARLGRTYSIELL